LISPSPNHVIIDLLNFFKGALLMHTLKYILMGHV